MNLHLEDSVSEHTQLLNGDKYKGALDNLCRIASAYGNTASFSKPPLVEGVLFSAPCNFSVHRFHDLDSNDFGLWDLGMNNDRTPSHPLSTDPLRVCTPSPPTKSFDFRGFDSSKLLIRRVGNSYVRRI